MNPRAALPLAIALAAGCQEEVADPSPPPLRPVRYSSVEAVDPARARIFAGAATAAAESRLSFKVSGTIVDLAVEVGDTVERGQAIARIDPVEYQLSVERSQAALADSEARLRNAEATYRRVQALFERDNMSQNDYDAARAAVQSARAGVRSVQKQLEQARLKVEHCTLEAPVAGHVASVNVEVSENVQTGSPVVILNSAAAPEVVVGIPELLIGELRRGARVEHIVFTALPGRNVSGVVREISPVAAAGTTTYPVRISLTSGIDGIRPGMAAEVEFRFGDSTGQKRLVVPPQAVGEDRRGRFVWVVSGLTEGEATVSRRAVETGGLVYSGRSSAIEVTAGLQEGELVVTAGVSSLDDGQRVRVRPADRS